jgi:hypothetical protein
MVRIQPVLRYKNGRFQRTNKQQDYTILVPHVASPTAKPLDVLLIFGRHPAHANLPLRLTLTMSNDISDFTMKFRSTRSRDYA